MTDVDNTTDTDKTVQKVRGVPFKSGDEWNGNALGRPVGSRNFGTIFEEAIKLIVKEQKVPVKDPEVEMVVKAVTQALKGNYAFYKDIMDRTYGSTNRGVDVQVNTQINNYFGVDTMEQAFPIWLQEAREDKIVDGERVREGCKQAIDDNWEKIERLHNDARD